MHSRIVMHIRIFKKSEYCANPKIDRNIYIHILNTISNYYDFEKNYHI